jgi:hypothetical protein
MKGYKNFRLKSNKLTLIYYSCFPNFFILEFVKKMIFPTKSKRLPSLMKKHKEFYGLN